MTRFRNVLGWLGILLAPITLSLGFLAPNEGNWWWSISATWYSSVSFCMVGLLVAIGIFMLVYPGYDWLDRLVTVTTAICCFGTVMFPCYYPGVTKVGWLLLAPTQSAPVHFIFAGALFLMFAVHIGVLFTRSDSLSPKTKMKIMFAVHIGVFFTRSDSLSPKTKMKTVRNRIYAITAVLILVVTAICACTIVILGDTPLVIVYESIVLALFGFSWLVKGGTFRFLNDK